MNDFPTKVMEAIRPDMDAQDLAKGTTMAALVTIARTPKELSRWFGSSAPKVARLINRAIQIKSNNVPKRTR